jgi:hypothetical protein
MRSGWRRGILALVAMWTGACSLDDRAEVDIPAWETYLEWSTREFEGRTIYVAEGDIAVTLEELRAHYDEWVAAVLAAQDGEPGIGRTERESLVNVVNGVDDIWPLSVTRDISYCVSDEFGANKNRAIAEMVNATRDWERHANVNFRHLGAHDASCNNSNTAVVFSVRPWSGSGACAFFPSGGGCVPRTLVMNFGAFSSPVTTQGVFKHELGHILGLRHEHIRVSGTSCSETGVARALTSYDSSSVMHYPWCPGATNTGDLFLTASDIAGVKSLYGPASAHGFAWVTATAGVSSTYAFNSVGGTISAFRVEPVIDPGVAGAAPAAGVIPPPIFVSGQYIVTFGGLGGLNGNVQVVAYGNTSTRCKVASWSNLPGNLTIDVRCHLPDGTPAWSPFVVQYSRKATLADWQGGYMWANKPTTTSYCADIERSWNSADDLNCVLRNGTGDYSVSFGSLFSVGGVGGTFQVTAFGTGGEHCKIQNWGPSGTAQQARVRCFNAAGSPADAAFSINHFPNGEVGAFDYGAYAWANNATATSYTPSTTYSYNSGRINGWPGCVGFLGTVVAGKASTNPGHYFLRYQYLTPFNSAAHSTAYGSDASYCKVEGWGSSGDAAQVQTQCYSAGGAKQNSLYIGTYATSLVRGPC